jgi:hypothetical protein
VSFKDPSEETFAAFGRLTIAFGRLESMVDWLMAMLAVHRDGRGMTVDVWKEHLSRKLDRINELARAPGLPSQTQREVRSFARLVKQLSDERRQLVHAMVSWEMSSPPFPC